MVAWSKSHDWIHRDITLVATCIQNCQLGKTTCYYAQGHPHRIHAHRYLSEIYYCRSLYDANDILSSFKTQVAQYPAILKKTVIEKYLAEALYTLKVCKSGKVRIVLE